MRLPWKLNGVEYVWPVPRPLWKHYRSWLENRDVPDQYRDLYPQALCRVFEAWIRAKERIALAKLEIKVMLAREKTR